MAEDVLQFDQVNTRLEQVSGVTVLERVAGNLFFNPMSRTTAVMAT